MRASEPDPGAPFHAAGLSSVVLAAGRGRRFEALGNALPKALLPILGKPLVTWQLEALRALGQRAVVLVIGHRQELLREHLGDGAALGLELAFVEQAEPLGIAHALVTAAPHLQQPFVCLLGDVFFDAEDLARLARALVPGVDAVLGVRREASASELARNYAVTVDAQGWVRAVEEKPSAARGPKGVGLYAFRPPFLAVAGATPPSALRGERELTDAIQRHLEAGARVRAVEFAGLDFNLSTPADLLAANLHALARAGCRRWIEAGARVPDEARLERAVVLRGARVAPGARLERVLVLEGQEVPPGDHCDVVFAGGVALSCADPEPPGARAEPPPGR